MRLKYALLISLALSSSLHGAGTIQESQIYLLTILPGKEVYSIYGHSALRIVIPEANYDRVFNWGVFDFSTPNFGYRFASGRLNYMLASYPYDRFLQEYFLEQRTVISQKVLLEPGEKERLIHLATENLKPENIFYLYDFFYDNCATRIRDIIRNSVDGEISLSVTKRKVTPTFRELIDKYQKPYRWLDMGIDLLLGLPADKKASADDQMFLPDFLMSNLSEAMVVRVSGSSELLAEPEVIIEFEPVQVEARRLTSPMFVLWTLLAFIMILSLSNIKSKWMRRIDIVIFSIYSLTALLLVFTVFFTDHMATKWNLNILWLSPLVVATLVHLIINVRTVYWYRINLSATILFLAASPLLQQSLNRYFVPLILILIVRLFFLSAFGKTT